MCLFVPTRTAPDARKHSRLGKPGQKLATELCLFVPAPKVSAPPQAPEKIWRPRRDLNPCYRRERSRCNYKAAVATQCPVRNGGERQGTGIGGTVLVPRVLNQWFLPRPNKKGDRRFCGECNLANQLPVIKTYRASREQSLFSKTS